MQTDPAKGQINIREALRSADVYAPRTDQAPFEEGVRNRIKAAEKSLAQVRLLVAEEAGNQPSPAASQDVGRLTVTESAQSSTINTTSAEPQPIQPTTVYTSAESYAPPMQSEAQMVSQQQQNPPTQYAYVQPQINMTPAPEYSAPQTPLSSDEMIHAAYINAVTQPESVNVTSSSQTQTAALSDEQKKDPRYWDERSLQINRMTEARGRIQQLHLNQENIGGMSTSV